MTLRLFVYILHPVLFFVHCLSSLDFPAPFIPSRSHPHTADQKEEKGAAPAPDVEYTVPTWTAVKPMLTHMANLPKPKSAKLTSKYGFLKKPMAVGSDVFVWDEAESLSTLEAWQKGKILSVSANDKGDLQYVRAE
jgi:hypothetical protein